VATGLRPLLRRQLLADFDLTHEKVGQRIIREELATSSVACGAARAVFETGAHRPGVDLLLMGKSYTVPTAEHPRWLAHLKPLLSGIYTADTWTRAARSYMCGSRWADRHRADHVLLLLQREGLTLDRGGIQAFIMFLNARFYLYTNVYYHRTTRASTPPEEIFRETMKLVFPSTEQGAPALPQHDRVDLLEEVATGTLRRPGPPGLARVAPVLDRHSSGACPRGGARPLRAAAGPELHESGGGRAAVRELLPPGLHAFRSDRHGQQDPRPLTDRHAGRQIYIYDAASRTVSASRSGAAEVPARQGRPVRIFAMSHEHDQRLAAALEQASGRPARHPPTSNRVETGVMESFAA